VAEVGRYAGKRNNKDKVDGIINTYQSRADYNAIKARDRASIDALSQSNQKKAPEALLSSKQMTGSFDTRWRAIDPFHHIHELFPDS
jgi:hypothetical protein